MHTLKLLLDTTKADEVFISSIFDAIAKVHNILVAEGKKRLRMLKRDKRYKYAREHYGKAAAAAAKLDKKLQSLQKKLDDEKNVDKAAARKLKQQIKEIRDEFETGTMDHVHLFVTAPPKLSPSLLVQYLKGIRDVRSWNGTLTLKSSSGTGNSGTIHTLLRPSAMFPPKQSGVISRTSQNTTRR